LVDHHDLWVHRAWARADTTPAVMTTCFRVVSDVTLPDAIVSTLRTFAVEDGHPGAIATWIPAPEAIRARNRAHIG
jgi:hypothetical protein